MSPTKRNAIIDNLDLVRCTDRTITDPDELRRECDRILERGYSLDHAEANDGIHCFAGPIYSPTNELVGTLWISGPAKRLPKSRFAELGEKARAAGARASRRIAEMS
jgi:DNA-binding IclR family transcriptional regulator